MSEFNLTRIDRLRYRPTREAESFLAIIRNTLLPGDKATIARLAIARSLVENDNNPYMIIPEGVEYGHAIEGVHLFGEDADIWSCHIVASVESPPQDAVTFRELVEAHWHRGMLLLKSDFEEVGNVEVDFVTKLVHMIPESTTKGSDILSDGTEGAIIVHFGSVSRDFESQEEVTIEINAPGVSPHISLLGKTRSGKTRTGLEIGAEIALQTNIPIVLIDPKGEFVRDGSLISKPEWNGNTLEKFFPGIQPVDIPNSPLPLDFLAIPPMPSATDLPQLAMSFKDSFLKCIKARGDIASDLLRQAVLAMLERYDKPITLENIFNEFANASQQEGRNVGSIGAKLSEMISLNLVVPEMNPASFFSQRWVIGLGEASPEPKRLIIFLLLDALKNYMLHQQDSAIDKTGYRTLRHILMIDEAKEVLAYRHEAISSLIRRGASKGEVVILLSQSPDDFEQEEDDFLENMGTIGVYASSSQKVKKLSAGFGRRLRAEEFSDRALPMGVALVKTPGHSPRKITGWQ